MSGKFSKFMTSFDLFGHPITVHYAGDDKYKTRLGAFMSIAVFSLILFNFINLSTVYMDGSR